jgi:hypothetical protein
LGLIPFEGFNIIRWDMTPDGWGILLGEAESAADIDKFLNMWRAAGAGFFKVTRTAPAQPVLDVIKQHGELLKLLVPHPHRIGVCDLWAPLTYNTVVL